MVFADKSPPRLSVQKSSVVSISIDAESVEITPNGARGCTHPYPEMVSALKRTGETD